MKNHTLYAETIPVFIRFIVNLRAIIAKGENYLITNGVSLTESDLLEAKLAPDMYSFTKQIGYMYFMALETAVNLTGREMPKFTYDEKSLAELKDSLLRVEEFLKSIREEEINDDLKEIKTFLDETETFSSEIYVRELALPNFFFHMTTAYDILRHLGVPLGKDNYLGLV